MDLQRSMERSYEPPRTTHCLRASSSLDDSLRIVSVKRRGWKVNGRFQIDASIKNFLVPCHGSLDILACSSRWKVNSGSFGS
mmetsp:Transcript_21925/g.43918  ORF Transcript_21925/g.43918 Transcript_21925/m.43918 type:complete len:82 (-) Transcript_21925:80-325(-)